jgi:hypothetical protein
MPYETQEIRRAEEEASAFRNYVALGFMAVLVAAAVWMFMSFKAHNRTIECFESGRHDCMPLDTSERGPPR